VLGFHLVNPRDTLLAAAFVALDADDCVMPCNLSLDNNVDLTWLAGIEVEQFP
jgi:hypothetical protein